MIIDLRVISVLRFFGYYLCFLFAMTTVFNNRFEKISKLNARYEHKKIARKV